MDLRIKISLLNENGKPFMGIGVVWLLEAVDRTGSIRRAAAGMDLSYVKALKMVRRLEAGLGKEIVLPVRGGSGGGGTRLTDFGRKFVRDYDRFQRRVKHLAGEEFRRFQSRYAGPERPGQEATT